MALLGGIIGGAFSLGAAALSAKAAKEEAARQRKFQERMYRNQVLYRTEDLERSGINRILAPQFSGGAGPPGAAAQIDYEGAAAVQAGSSAFKAATDAKLKKEQINLLKEQQLTEKDLRNKRGYENAGTAANTANTLNQTKMQKMLIPGIKAQMAVDQSGFGKMMKYIKTGTSVLPFVNSGGNSAAPTRSR